MPNKLPSTGKNKSPENNPYNTGSELYKRLTRLFSGPIVNYRHQQLRFTTKSASQRNKYGNKFRSAHGQTFKKAQYNPFDSLSLNYMVQHNRYERYNDFDQMEYTPEIASAMDIYADEMTTSNDYQKMVNVKCPNEEIKGIIGTLLYTVLNIESNLFGWARSMCKYGDFFLYLDLDEEIGIKTVIGLPIEEVERREGEDPDNPDYVQFVWEAGGITFENWQVAHFRILGNEKHAPYGSSVLEPARRIWRQLTLMEDAMMAYRIVRSPERRVFYIDVGNIPPNDVEQYMQRIMMQMKRNQVVDATTGRVDLRYNPMSIDEDYFIPQRAGQSSKIESLPGGAFTGDIDDVNYLRDKLFSALKIPKSYLAHGEGAEEDKTTLAQKDIRFSRTIQRLQHAMISELEKIVIIHLYTIGYREADLISFKLSLNNPSKIAELQELEHWRTKFDVASAATEGFFSRRWVATKLFNLSEEEYMRIQQEMYHDKKFDALLEKAAAAVGGDGEGGEEGGMGDLGGDLGGDEGGELDLGGDLGGDEGGEEGGDEGGLLAAPGMRDDDGIIVGDPTKGYLTAGAKGKRYVPQKTDSRKLGARNRSFRSQYSDSTGRNNRKNIYKGYHDLKSLSSGVVSEETDDGEKLIFEVNNGLRDLIISMEKNLNENKNQTQ
jgi:hypothetical protein